MKLTAIVLASSVASAAAANSASADAAQPVLSERYEMPDAKQALDEVKTRWEAANAQQVSRFSAHKGPYDEFVRSDPILQDVTWLYGPCTDMLSLIPPPAKGWAIASAAPFKTNPIGEDVAEIYYTSFEPGVASDAPDFHNNTKSVYINLSTSPQNVAAIEMMLSQEALRDVAFEVGPFGYPIGRYGSATLIGNVTVTISGSGEGPAKDYLQTMIECAISSGFIAKGVDKDALTDTP